MKALVLVDGPSGVEVRWDLRTGAYEVFDAYGERIHVFVNGNAQKIGRARKIARRWWERDYPLYARCQECGQLTKDKAQCADPFPHCASHVPIQVQWATYDSEVAHLTRNAYGQIID